MKLSEPSSMMTFLFIYVFLTNSATLVISKKDKDRDKYIEEQAQLLQFPLYTEIKADFAVIDLDDPSFPASTILTRLNLEKNIIMIESYVVKAFFPPLQRVQIIDMKDIVVFNDFEVLFNMNLMGKNLFGIPDKERFTKVQYSLERLRNRFGQNSENCRFLFTNSIENMFKVGSIPVNHVDDVNSMLYLSLNIFCFPNIDMAITFNTNFTTMYNNFVLSIMANNLLFYNKSKYNNLKIIFKSVRSNELGNVLTLPDVEPRPIPPPEDYQTTPDINYAFLMFSQEGALFADAPGRSLKNVLYSFAYDTIKDCRVSLVQNYSVLPKKMVITEGNKCCIKMNVDIKEVYDTVFSICSFRYHLFQCNLEAKFIQEALMNKCAQKLEMSVNTAFENNFSIRDYVSNFSSFSQDYVFTKLYEFILKKIKLAKMMPKERSVLIENKLATMIQDLGPEFQRFLKVNSIQDVTNLIRPSILPVPLLPLPHPVPGMVILDHPLPGMTTVIPPQPPSLLIENPVPRSNIFSLCETHPKMKDCLCAAFPLSTICTNDYCANHPNYYECSPAYCIARPEDTEACKCKFMPFDTSCKCLLNPIRKECFCIKYPTSIYCLPDYCKKINNNSEIYCICAKNPFAPECRPGYCHENKFDVRCQCLLNPQDPSCKCVINPGANKNCEKILEANNTRNLKNKKQKKVISNLKPTYAAIKPQTECNKDDIFCLCKDHPFYKKCVCLAYPQAEICDDSFCKDILHMDDYECNPRYNCINDMNEKQCECKKEFGKECKCKLNPFSNFCFCKKNPEQCINGNPLIDISADAQTHPRKKKKSMTTQKSVTQSNLSPTNANSINPASSTSSRSIPNRAATSSSTDTRPSPNSNTATTDTSSRSPSAKRVYTSENRQKTKNSVANQLEKIIKAAENQNTEERIQPKNKSNPTVIAAQQDSYKPSSEDQGRENARPHENPKSKEEEKKTKDKDILMLYNKQLQFNKNIQNIFGKKRQK